jgi:RNA polymerase sigma factor (sigma-70 family)
MDNTKLIELIRSGNNQTALKELYKSFPSICHFIKMHGGNEDEAKDIFQESLFIFYRNVQRTDFQLTAALNTYLFSICKYLWKDELKKKNRIVSYEVKDAPVEDLDDSKDAEHKSAWLDKVIQSLGAKCIEILQLFYYQKLSMEQIATQLDYKNTDTVKTQKYKCIERAKQMAKEQSLKSVNDIL